MKLALLGSVALLLAGALGAEAATSSARYAVTLEGTVVDAVTYTQSGADGEDCRIERSGSGGRSLAVKSLRAATVRVTRSGSRVVYEPRRLAVRVTGSTGRGSLEEIRICRAQQIQRKQGDCRGEQLAPRRAGQVFRRAGANAIGLAAPRQVGEVGACGLGRLLPGGWLDQAVAKVDEAALLRGRSSRVVAKASGTATALIGDPSGARITRRTTVRWTLTFRRLG